MRRNVQPSRSSRRARLAGERRGITLVMVAVSLVAVLGLAGVGVDFARAYAARARLKTKADAAALAGAVELLAGRTANAGPRTVALHYDSLNWAEGNAIAAIPADDVRAVAYNFNTGAVTSYGANFAHPQVNAVEVITRYNSPTLFAGVFSRSHLALRERTVAALGGVGTQNCIRPWVVSYQTLINQLNQLSPSTSLRDTSYNLTSADVNTLSQNTTPVSLLAGGNNTTAPGNIGQVAVWDTSYARSTSSNQAYINAIVGSVPCGQTLPVASGTVLQANPGNGTNPTGNAVETLCSSSGGVTNFGNGSTSNNGGGNNNGFTCNTPPLIRLGLWSQVSTNSGANVTYTIKYVGAFKITGFQPGANGNGNQAGACGASNAVDQVCGVFTSMAINGAFTGSPGLTRKAALVY